MSRVKASFHPDAPRDSHRGSGPDHVERSGIVSFFDDFQGETTMPGATPLGVPEAVAAKFEAKPKNKKGWLAGGIGLGLVALLAIAAGASSSNSSDSGSSSGSSDAYSWSYQQCYDALDQNPYEVGQLTEYE